MLFTHDTELNLSFLPALANTVAGASESGADEISTRQQLAAFLIGWKYPLPHGCSEQELRDVRAARDSIRDIWTADEAAVVEWINSTLTRSRAAPQLVNHDGLGWHIHATDDSAPLAERILAEAAMSLIDVVRGGRIERLRECEADDCDGVLVDLSKNGSKRYCSVRCGNRMAARAYRARALEG